MSSRYPRYSYRGRPAGRRFGAAGYRGGVGKRRVYRRRSTPLRSAMVRYRAANVAYRGYIGMGRRFEQKFKDLAITPNANTTGAVSLLNGIQQGTTPSTRIGSVVMMTKLQLRMTAAVVPTTGVDQQVRILIVYDRQTNGAALTGALVLTNFDTTAFQLLENRDRFIVLYDQTVNLNASAESGSDKYITRELSLHLPAVFIAGAGTADTIADIKTGSLYFMTVGTEAAGATAATVDVGARLWFNDK